MKGQPEFFEFTSYEFTPGQNRIFFHYRTAFESGEVMDWTEIIILPKPAVGIPAAMLESLHLMLGISYWKFYCLPAGRQVRQPYQLTKQQADFFNTVYKKGLGEFFNRNNLDPKISPKFSYDKTVKPIPASSSKLLTSILLGIGGGKDSIVSAELLREANHPFTSFHIDSTTRPGLVDDVIKLIGKPVLKIRRILDPKVHDKHAYNGHVPVSAIYAFLGILSCVLYGYKYFIVSNEHSSNFGNIKYLPAGRQGKGLDVNHQWSKSLEFELLFSDYVKNSISPDIGYFSLLRPFHEIRIVKLFSKYPKYFRHFSSCNRNFSIKDKTHKGLWCGECPKCIFAFTLLSAFLSKKELLGIFGQNLYAREDLLPMFKDILGLGAMKPFDCVGTFEEAQTAFTMAGQKFLKSKIHPEVFRTAKNNVPEEFKFLGMESALILGYGKEGKITRQFLKKHYPKLKIGVGDSALDKQYLKKQENFDIAVKTPGIHKSLVTIPYTTATNIFFSCVKGSYKIIGVTGSKGKSTTASLIYAIIKEARKNTQLLGNIGTPMLGALLQPIQPETIFVLELSSYQLDDITFSPDIAVVTNLFPEHMDFHGSVKNYYAAKKNIFKFRSSDSHVIFCPTAKERFESNLPGPHNILNINAAASVCRILKIPEQTIKGAIKKFKGLPHRLENIGTYRGITFYDDAISTTPESTIMAIKSIPNIGAIFLGGQDRGYDFSPLEKVIRKYKIENIVLFPDSGKRIFKDFKYLNILRTKSMEEAVTFAYANTPAGQACLLSCASPSYSLWKNFEVKGDEFKKFVKKQGTH